MLTRYDTADASSVLKLRTLVTCGSCGGLGNGPELLSGLAMAGLEVGWHHGRCVVQRLDADRVLALPEAERDKIRLGDVQVLGQAGIELMRRLIAASA